MGLFTPKWKSDDVEKALKAVAKINDQAQLAEIAVSAQTGYLPDKDVQYAAVKKLTNPAFLMQVVKNPSTGKYALRAAFEKTTDRAFVEYIAVTPGSWEDVRYTAISMLTDPAVLEHIASTDSNIGLRRKAVENEHFNNQEMLKEIISSSDDFMLVCAAADKLQDKDFLTEFARENEGKRQAVLKRVEDQALLEEIAMQDESETTRQIAIMQLTDQSALARVAQKESSTVNRNLALGKITDLELKQAAMQVSDEKIDELCVAFASEQKHIRMDAATELYHIFDTASFSQEGRKKLLNGLRAEMKRQVPNEFRYDLGEFNGNQYIGKLLSRFYNNVNLSEEERTNIESLNGCLVSYSEHEGRRTPVFFSAKDGIKL